ncbi:MAG: nucleoside 2-deoxyribosyltransferase [Burkholderiaceae bacterium]|nr:nucleoside 2-deoxyribosyltransferase [Burkholderiaceae bacterium]MCD8516117.1 nucleoside 2-deoxyribosyltransferase [Burkholderiaceae bacterium]MCD8536299.1 nucleoside 2-deoxyribosyltransferase [Burkholderiaceae bacterium]MCD8564772.1 nucleoside 2-deoxyribosyltransferase [Burkholderiaceae bacterium]
MAGLAILMPSIALTQASDQPVRKIYCAGPLFNQMERAEMAQIAAVLEKSGFKVFLPQRDGLEMIKLIPAFAAAGVPEAKAKDIINKAIFSLDVFQVLDSDGLVLNMNGRVPDDGALVETGIAWQAGKAIVIYKNDARTLIDGNDNPLISGLSDFHKVDEIEAIAAEFHRQFQAGMPVSPALSARASEVVARGKQIQELLLAKASVDVTVRTLIRLLDD